MQRGRERTGPFSYLWTFGHYTLLFIVRYALLQVCSYLGGVHRDCRELLSAARNRYSRPSPPSV
jgi:hypothetical protein